MPYDGKLDRDDLRTRSTIFSVAPYSTEVIKGLYSRNERVASIFKTEIGLHGCSHGRRS